MDEKKLLQTFGFNFKIERMKLKLSQEDVALDFGFSKSYISNVECGKHRISLINAYKLSKIVDKTIEELLHNH